MIKHGVFLWYLILNRKWISAEMVYSRCTVYLMKWQPVVMGYDPPLLKHVISSKLNIRTPPWKPSTTSLHGILLVNGFKKCPLSSIYIKNLKTSLNVNFVLCVCVTESSSFFFSSSQYGISYPFTSFLFSTHLISKIVILHQKYLEVEVSRSTTYP